MRKDDFYITTLKYGRNALAKSEGVNYNEVRDHVRSIHPKLNDEAFSRIFWSAFEALQDFGTSSDDRIKNNTPHTLNLEAYFHLLEHEELEEARTSSRRALRVATWAIGIAIATAVVSTFIQLTVPTNVVFDDQQIELLLIGYDVEPGRTKGRDELNRQLRRRAQEAYGDRGN